MYCCYRKRCTLVTKNAALYLTENAALAVTVYSYTHFADGDVAFAKITPCFQNRKSVIFSNLPNGIGAGTTELKVLRPFGETINRWYFLFFLESAYFIDEAIFKGTANQQRIISGYLENKLFPLPPLQEQARIVERIKAIASIMSR